jgi:TetR/AcrR family transcriptional regulator, tetracycline repressor protein
MHTTYTKAGRGRPRRIDPDAVAARALAIADAEGLEAVTMRRLAAEMSVTPMSLYRHFADKEALLRSVGELIGEEIRARREPEPTAAEADVWERMRRRIDAAVSVLAGHHPDLAMMLQARPAEQLSGEATETRSAVREMLAEVGIAGAEAEQLVLLLRQSVFMLAHASREAPAASRQALLDLGIDLMVDGIRARAV